MNPLLVFLRAERRPMLAWAAGLGAFVMMLGGVYASFDDPAELDQLLENYPEDLLEIFGDVQDIGSVKGFLGIELSSYMPLIVGIFAIMLMTKHLAGAEESGALDHVLARPITRAEYYWALVGASVVIVAVMLLGASIGGILGFLAADVALKDLIGIVGLLFDFLPIALVYIGLGGLLGAAFHRRGVANAIGIGVVIAFFALDVVGRLVDELDWLSYVTPHGYLGRSDLFSGDLDLGYAAFSLALFAVFAVLGAMRFEGKDLYA